MVTTEVPEKQVELDKEGKSGIDGVDITPKQDGGVLKQILQEGTGETKPASGCHVYVHYDGKLTDGTVFDSSRDRGTPFDFQLGKGKVIRGWDIGIATMKVGEKAVLTIREDYGYGKSGSPPKIPPKATLVFEVELMEFEPENLSGKKDKGVLRYPITPGTNFESPKSMADVSIHLKGEYDGRVFDDREVSFMLGTGSSLDIPYGVEKALEHFTLNETSKLEIKPKYGFGSVGNEKLKIPADATLTYIVTLKSFQQSKESWQMENNEKLTEAKRLKEKGTEYFKKNDLKLALKMYKSMLTYLEDAVFEDNEEEEKERKTLLIAAHSNVSLCQLKLLKHHDAINSCASVLELDPDNQKALFRRGQALLAINEPEKARLDFEKVIQLDPSNKAAASQIIACGAVQKQIRQKEKKMYADMFEKFAQKDREWRFGWLEGEKPQVEIAPENPEIELEKIRRREAKRKFIEDQARRLKEKRELEEKERKEKEAKKEESAEENSESQKEEEKNEEPVKVNSEPPNVEEVKVEENQAGIENKDLQTNGTCKYKEEEERKKQPDVMKGCFGEWGADEREREPSDFEKENPDILMLEGSGDFKNM